MGGETVSLDAAWAEIQLDLLDLPRPCVVLAKLRALDPNLYEQLCRGERWLLQQTEAAELRRGWMWWLSFYQSALEVTGEQTAARRDDA